VNEIEGVALIALVAYKLLIEVKTPPATLMESLHIDPAEPWLALAA
jgi:hypothetical protein